MNRRIGLGLVIVALLAAGVVVAAVSDPKKEGRTSPSKLQLGSGRDLNPAGKMTQIGNYPAGGALTTNGRFLWTVSAGRGKNDIRIVRVETGVRCKKGRRGKRCRRRNGRRIGRVVQTIPMPGANGGIVAAPGRQDSVRVGYARPLDELRPVARGHARQGGRRHSRLPLQRPHRKGDANRHDRRARPRRHPAAAGLPPHPHRPGLMATRPRDQP